jgi:hypothetical protein
VSLWSVIMLSVIIQSAIMQSVFMLNVVALLERLVMCKHSSLWSHS